MLSIAHVHHSLTNVMVIDRHHMTEILKNTSKIKRRCIFWRTKSYDDECLLKHLRQANSDAQMSIITELLNSLLSASRQRSIDSVSFKWKKLKPKAFDHRSLPSSSSKEELDEVLQSQIESYVRITIFSLINQARRSFKAIKSIWWNVTSLIRSSESLQIWSHHRRIKCFDWMSALHRSRKYKRKWQRWRRRQRVMFSSVLTSHVSCMSA